MRAPAASNIFITVARWQHPHVAKLLLVGVGLLFVSFLFYGCVPNSYYKTDTTMVELQQELQQEVKGLDKTPAALANRATSEEILTEARRRGHALANELESVLSLGPVPSHLDALVLESLLPFSREMDQAFEQGDLRRVQTVSRQWRSWLKRSRPYVAQEAKDILQKQLAHLDKLDRQLGDPVLGKLTMKLARAIKQERWEDAKNIQELIRGMQPPTLAVTASPVPIQPTDTHTGSVRASGREEARAEYKSALAAYNRAIQKRDNSRTVNSLMRMSAANESAKGPGLMTGLSFLTSLVSDAEEQGAGRELEIAKERLNRAKARLDSFNWR